MNISHDFLKEALGHILNTENLRHNATQKPIEIDEYIFGKNMLKVSNLLNNNANKYMALKTAIAYLHRFPEKVCPPLISYHTYPFNTVEIKTFLSLAFQHFWQEQEVSTYDFEYLMPIHIVDIPENEWEILMNPSKGGLFD